MAEKAAEAAPEKQKQPEAESQERAKKWKGKDWYVILAPKLFGEVFVAETPATDPDTLIGRTVDVNLADITNQQNRYYVKLRFRVTEVSGKNALTQFSGYEVLREHVGRFVRKRSQKAQLVLPLRTKDGWDLQATLVAVLARKTKTEIERSVRRAVAAEIQQVAGRSELEDVVKRVTTGGLQADLKRVGNKVYPLKFLEVSKIEVHGAPWMQH